jgi:two-component system response regulator NreC
MIESPDPRVAEPGDLTTEGANGPGVSIVLVDDRTLVRQGIRALIDQQPGLAVVGEADGAHAATRVAVAPDVIVTEIDLPDAKGPDVIGLLRGAFGRSALLILTSVSQPAKVEAVLAAGANGYLLKTASNSELFDGIRAAARGATYLQPSLAFDLVQWHSRRNSTPRLTPKEEEILGFVALGHTNAEVARLANIGLRTVESHRARILEKLGRSTRAELVQYARAAGLFDVDPV